MDLIENSLQKLEKWIEDHDYKGYEPFDGLSSSLRPLTFGNLFLTRVLMQFVRQNPINVRPLIGIKPLDSTKGRGYVAWGYLKMLQLTGLATYKSKAVECLEWLIENKSPKFQHFSWANHFDFAARGGMYTKDESIIVWTALIGQAFLDAYEMIGDNKYLEVALSACEWIMELPRETTASGDCLSYLAFTQSSIHNSNMLGGAILARAYKYTGNEDYRKVAKSAMLYSCSRQLQDGAWNYGEGEKWRWIDNFHTGYNLDSLKSYIDNTGDEEFNDNLTKGFSYFTKHFIEANGRPKYYHNRTYPIDIQCAAQAIDTLTKFSVYDKGNLALARKVAEWTIVNMQDPTGFFYYRLLPKIKVKIPMLHWGQATMYKALSSLLLEESRRI